MALFYNLYKSPSARRTLLKRQMQKTSYHLTSILVNSLPLLATIQNNPHIIHQIATNKDIITIK